MTASAAFGHEYARRTTARPGAGRFNSPACPPHARRDQSFPGPTSERTRAHAEGDGRPGHEGEGKACSAAGQAAGVPS